LLVIVLTYEFIMQHPNTSHCGFCLSPCFSVSLAIDAHGLLNQKKNSKMEKSKLV